MNPAPEIAADVPRIEEPDGEDASEPEPSLREDIGIGVRLHLPMEGPLVRPGDAPDP